MRDQVKWIFPDGTYVRYIFEYLKAENSKVYACKFITIYALSPDEDFILDEMSIGRSTGLNVEASKESVERLFTEINIEKALEKWRDSKDILRTLLIIYLLKYGHIKLEDIDDRDERKKFSTLAVPAPVSGSS